MSKRTNYLGWVVGSIALCAAAFLIVPPLITKISSMAYKASNKNLDEETLFPEPVVEKKENSEGKDGENNG